MKVFKIFLIIFIILIFLTGVLFINKWHIDFSEELPSEITVEYGEDVKIKPLKAYLRGEIYCKDGFELDVLTTGSVNSNKIGCYEIQYNTSFWFFEKELTINYNVVDTIPPEIILNSINGYRTIEGEIYEEEGFSAYDNYDGEITENVTSYIDGNIVYYTVSDSSGNSVVKTREITFFKPNPPILTLIGDSIITIKQDNEFIEPGYAVIDYFGNDITDKVVIESNLNNKIAGEYEIKYIIKDDYDNVVTATRKVIVKPEKIIYLTFDDGPSKYTKDLLAILKKHDVKATFFVVGLAYQNVITDIYNDGHAIGVHSLTHEYKDIYLNEENYFADLNAMRENIFNRTGHYTNLVRFPGGSSNTISKNYNHGIMTRLTNMLIENGYQYFDWNVSSGDAGAVWTKEDVYANVISGIRNKKVAIVLQHDTKKYSIDAVEDIILWGKANGYTFLPLTMDSPAFHHGLNN